MAHGNDVLEVRHLYRLWHRLECVLPELVAESVVPRPRLRLVLQPDQELELGLPYGAYVHGENRFLPVTQLAG
jgi:hypothetical protein